VHQGCLAYARKVSLTGHLDGLIVSYLAYKRMNMKEHLIDIDSGLVRASWLLLAFC